jgi:hypothetical protein
MVLGPEGVNRRWRLAHDVRERPVRISHRIGLEPDRLNPGETCVTHGREHQRGKFGLGSSFPIGHSFSRWREGFHLAATFDASSLAS